MVQLRTYVTLNTSLSITALDDVKAFAQNNVPDVAVLAVAVDRKAPYTVMPAAIVNEAGEAAFVAVAVDVDAIV